MSNELLELAARCENATGPDRELDAEIEVAVAGFPERAYQQRNAMRPKGSPDLDRMQWLASWGIPAFTGSIDAAMGLVPEGWAGRNVFPFVSRQKLTLWQAGIGVPGPPLKGTSAYAATPALALTAAALRARASIGGE
jgi:hypothetical protein